MENTAKQLQVLEQDYREKLAELLRKAFQQHPQGSQVAAQELANIFGKTTSSIWAWRSKDPKRWCKASSAKENCLYVIEYLKDLEAKQCSESPVPVNVTVDIPEGSMEYKVDGNSMVRQAKVRKSHVDQTLELLIQKRGNVCDRIDEIQSELEQLRDEDGKLQVAIEALRQLTNG